MKIGNHADKPAPLNGAGSTSPAQEAAKAQESASAIPATADPSTTIALSSAASKLLDNESGADFDADKVARISQAIEDGTFKINADVIADKLIGNAKELLTKSVS
ncbi:MAG TPA: flagellar biosynthesis anti-sigma factor FlgM [Burkholderiaceae bacterium]|nr:flagellar biosynthesis anti-sigma factor FlgM [Burkholderiaceae bacterium]